MDNVYERQNILNHFKNPKNFGRLKNPDKTIKVLNSFCGDEIEVDLKIEDGKVTEIGYDNVGCVISTASTSILSDYVKGKTIPEIQKIDKDKLIELIGIDITPSRLKCLLLPIEAIQKALK